MVVHEKQAFAIALALHRTETGGRRLRASRSLFILPVFGNGLDWGEIYVRVFFESFGLCRRAYELCGSECLSVSLLKD